MKKAVARVLPIGGLFPIKMTKDLSQVRILLLIHRMPHDAIIFIIKSPGTVDIVGKHVGNLYILWQFILFIWILVRWSKTP